MIPSAAMAIIPNRPLPYEADGTYAVEGVFMNELHALMLRCGTEQRMTGEEMRDWMNLLFVRLDRAIVMP